MELKEYIKQSERTMIDNGFSMNIYHASLGISTEIAEILDIVKKHFFYGKEFDIINFIEELGDIAWYLAIIVRQFDLVNGIETYLNSNVYKKDFPRYNTSFDVTLYLSDLYLYLSDFSHLLTKSYLYSESINHKEYLESYLFTDIKGTVNYKTSIPYFFGFIEFLAKQYNYSLEKVLQINIDKLAKRYPEKFDSNLALNRDLKAEREVLEGLNTKTEQVDYITELHDKGLYVDNSGIDSRVPNIKGENHV